MLIIINMVLLEVNGKVQSLEEIESRLRMSGGPQNGFSPSHNNVQFHEEMKLKKLQNMKVSCSIIIYQRYLCNYFLSITS